MIDETSREIWVGENRIYLRDDNVIHFLHVGKMTEEIALESVEAMRKLNTLGEGKVNYLIDFNKAGKGSSKGRKILKGFTENEIDGKLVFIGLHPVAMVIASFFMGATRKSDMRFFKKEEEALEWLNEEVKET